MLGFLVLALTLLLQDHVYPQPLPEAAPSVDFASGRAMKHLRAIAALPHPSGTRQNDSVFEYLLAELSRLRLVVEEHRSVYLETTHGGEVMAVRVRNLLARKPGTTNTKAVLLVAHYDAAVTSPGAADDGAGVAALLETARALTASIALRNDIYFLFTDGEELGLYGAKAFRRDHPSLQSVGAVLNFEARGTRGPSLMFETGKSSGWLVRNLVEAVPSPYANSLASSIYELMPNDTDFSVFKQAGLPGLNFAFVEDWPKYHTTLDSIANLKEGSLQHHGSYATALAKRLGQADLNHTAEGDLIYFNLLGPLMVVYSVRWALPLASAAALLYLGIVVDGYRRKRLRLVRLLIGIAIAPLTVVAAGLLCKAYLTYAVGGFDEGYLLYRAGHYHLAFTFLTALTVAFAFILSFRWLGMASSILGGLFCWTVLAVISSWLMPGASYVFVWPLLVNLAGSFVLMRHPEQQPLSGRRLGVVYMTAIGSALIIVPPFKMLALGLVLDGAYVASIYAALCLLLFAPQFQLILAPNRWVLPILMALATLSVSVGMRSYPVYDSTHPKSNSLVYILNHDRGSAVWVAPRSGFDPWLSEVLAAGKRMENPAECMPNWYSAGFFVPGGFVCAGAPRADIMPPTVSVLQDHTGDRRTIRLFVKSRREAPRMAIRFDSLGSLTLLDVDGCKPSDRVSNRSIVIHHVGSTDDGMEITMESTSAPVTLQVLDYSYNLPDSPALGLKPRPSLMMPTMSMGDGAIVFRSLTL